MVVATEQGLFFLTVRRATQMGADLDSAIELADAEINEVELCSDCGSIMRISYTAGKWFCPECGWKRAICEPELLF